MARGYVFYPTFTYLPGCISRDRPLDLRVNLRIFSTEGFRRNDSWPRQPGTGFRSLLAILNNFLISGPSLTTPPPETYVPPVHDNLIVRRTSQPTRATDTGPEPYKINTLSLFITFHDLYTPATWPSTTHEIFRMVKCFATSGVPYPYVKQVKASVAFDSPMASEGESRVYDQATWELLRKVYELQDVYEVPARMSVVALDKWRMDGFRFLLRRETW
ncbi:hypothetical protein Tdes44962_MAKER01286 [Teratosphaeria destructans]|uniref:Uncharacterized protein n=1 Tax=Teratosphaeria destructans TaxID=418781 RepID=A0A9W7T1E0_9PEZI|nr:hypothetical protein Tdes44962_MAKER01286 [Teratosphaeria destructans]